MKKIIMLLIAGLIFMVPPAAYSAQKAVNGPVVCIVDHQVAPDVAINYELQTNDLVMPPGNYVFENFDTLQLTVSQPVVTGWKPKDMIKPDMFINKSNYNLPVLHYKYGLLYNCNCLRSPLSLSFL
jgi:hypothetical protein